MNIKNFNKRKEAVQFLSHRFTAPMSHGLYISTITKHFNSDAELETLNIQSTQN